MSNAAAAALTVVIMAALASPMVAGTGQNGCHMYFIIYGEPRCPACRSMSAFVKDNYGEKCLEFRSIEEEAWRKNYDELISIMKLDAYVPLVGLIVDGRLVCVSQGATRDRGFWDSMASKHPSDKIPVYGIRGDRRVTETVPLSAVEQYFIPESPSSPASSEAKFAVLPAVVLLLGVIVAWMRWRK